MRSSTFSRGYFVLALAGTMACGDTAASQAARSAQARDADAQLALLAKPAHPRVAASAANVAVRSDPTIGAAEVAPAETTPLRFAKSLEHFFLGLAALEDGTAVSDVRITQFGDSHTAADIETGQIRRELQERFGDGGRGFVALGPPYTGYYQEGIRAGATGWKGERGKYVKGKFVGDGAYGLSGWSLVAQHAGARAWTDVRTPTSRIELDLLAQPGGGSVDLYIDGQKQARVKTQAADYGSTFQPFDVPEGPHHVEVRALGDGDVRLFGMALDRQTPGITFDALGINGARVTNALTWNEFHLEEQLRHRDPALVILAFGTNEAGDDTPPATYERQIVDLLARIERAAPAASCLIMGPLDRASKSFGQWETMPKIVEIVETEARVAEAAGCAFYDQMSAMGGPGTIAEWALEAPARAQRDRVHLTQNGYRQMGSLFAHDVLQAYAQWRTNPANAPANSTLPGTPFSVPSPTQAPPQTPPVPSPARPMTAPPSAFVPASNPVNVASRPPSMAKRPGAGYFRLSAE